jgi:UDP-N-acetylglucosamine 4,6-dehydratase
VTDVAEAIGPECEHVVVGIRPGEKIHEELITASDSFNTVDIGRYYAILPSADETLRSYYLAQKNAKEVPRGFSYNSGTNSEFLTVEQLRALIEKCVDSGLDH